MTQKIDLNIDVDRGTGRLPTIWRSFGYDEINWTYTARGKAVYKMIDDLSDAPYYIRCHNTFTSGNRLSTPTKGSTNICVGVEENRLRLDFDCLDQVFDTMVENHCHPIVELGFMPDLLSRQKDPGPTYDYQGPELWPYPPKDHDRWQELIFRTVEHCIQRYGEEEVASWYWELWNEPDNPGFFRGSVKDYCEMYDFAVAGATEAFAKIKIGGPGLASNPKFLRKFLKHCNRGKNASTGARGTRLDFISIHAKGTDWPLRNQEFIMPSLAKILSFVENYLAETENFPDYRRLPLLLDECDMAVATNFGVYDFPEFEINNSEYYPVFVIRMAKHLLDLCKRHALDLRFFTTWAFYFEGKRFFEGNRALVTNENIRKPVFNAFTMLERIPDRRLEVQFASGQVGNRDSGFPAVDALAARSDTTVSAVVWNFDERGSDVTRTVRLLLSSSESKSAFRKFRRFQIDGRDSNAYHIWRELGSPHNPTSEQIAKIKSGDGLEVVEEGRPERIEGGTGVSFELPSPGVALVEVDL